jgi:hypothetical protein
MVGSAFRSSFLFEHDLFGKPDSTFPDHAVAALNRRACGPFAVPDPISRIIAIHFSTWAKACSSVRASRFALGLDDVSAMSDMRVLH